MTKLIKTISACALTVASGLYFSSCGKGICHVLVTAKNEGVIYAGAMGDSKNGCAVGEDGRVRYTVDGGKTWNKGENRSSSLFSLSPIDEKICYASGEDKSFVKTTDGGKTWNSLKNHPAKRAKGVTFKNEEIGCVWTTGNAYEYDGTSDDWHAIKNPKGCGLVESVFSVEPGKAYLCGSNGMIYYTNDYGNNWEERKKVFDRKEDAVKPLIGQWIKTSEFDFDGIALRFAYLAEKDYVYTLFILKSVDGGRTFALESETKLPNIAKAIAFNGKNGISVYNTDGSLDFYIMK